MNNSRKVGDGGEGWQRKYVAMARDFIVQKRLSIDPIIECMRRSMPVPRSESLRGKIESARADVLQVKIFAELVSHLLTLLFSTLIPAFPFSDATILCKYLPSELFKARAYSRAIENTTSRASYSLRNLTRNEIIALDGKHCC